MALERPSVSFIKSWAGSAVRVSNFSLYPFLSPFVLNGYVRVESHIHTKAKLLVFTICDMARFPVVHQAFKQVATN